MIGAERSAIMNRLDPRLRKLLSMTRLLIALACIFLHGQILYGGLILFAGLLAKTLIALKAGWHVPD